MCARSQGQPSSSSSQHSSISRGLEFFVIFAIEPPSEYHKNIVKRIFLTDSPRLSWTVGMPPRAHRLRKQAEL
jgi:hypothetical protein